MSSKQHYQRCPALKKSPPILTPYQHILPLKHSTESHRGINANKRKMPKHSCPPKTPGAYFGSFSLVSSFDNRTLWRNKVVFSNMVHLVSLHSTPLLQRFYMQQPVMALAPLFFADPVWCSFCCSCIFLCCHLAGSGLRQEQSLESFAPNEASCSQKKG